MRILAIETSCDETAGAIIEIAGTETKLLTNVVASQIDVHSKYGGVIPDLAARMHTEALPVVLKEATQDKKITYQAVAVTIGPGLVGSLLIGIAAAKTIAMVKKIPFYAINHLEGHIYSAFLAEEKPELPTLAVIVSGGHTELVLMKRHLHYQLLGQSRDDAAGEAFDKVARLLDLGYPGGPAISELAIHGKEDEYSFPIGLREKDSLEFSFSGLKASVAYTVVKLPKPLAEHTKADLAACFQKTVTDTILRKVATALKKNPEIKSVCLVGGVSANLHLRKNLEEMINEDFKGLSFFVPDLQYCTDNAAMIASAAAHHYLFGQPNRWYDTEADPGLTLN